MLPLCTHFFHSSLLCSLPKAPPFHRRRRSLLSTSSIEHPLSHPIFAVWASNTGVGKTLVSAGLASSFLLSRPSSKVVYLKPVQTGFPFDSDSRFVFQKISELFTRRRPQFPVFTSNHTLNISLPAYNAVLDNGLPAEIESEGGCKDGFRNVGLYEERKLHSENGEVHASELICKTLYGWRDAVSPHLAVEREEASVNDAELLGTLNRCLKIGCSGDFGCRKGEKEVNGSVLTLVETAGGVASPGPSGSLQCDLYRTFRLPTILVGDGRLGGISGTISAYETLKLRGYDVAAVVFEDHGLVNEVPLASYLCSRVPVFVLPHVPQDMSDNLMSWFDESEGIFSSLKETILAMFSEKVKRLHTMPQKAQEVFWWPFTQHKLVPEDNVTVIDSRCGENFIVYKVEDCDVMTQQFDACASWWTQGPDATMQIELARDIGYAAARFGHVMFPENVYEPALECAELLLGGVGKEWASRVYFSDNGSTAIEIALKMAFRKFLLDHEFLLDIPKANFEDKAIDLKVLALRGSYHGDTLGAMEAQAPSSYTGILQQPWYSGRGLFLDPPTVCICNGKWKLFLPQQMQFEVEMRHLFFGLRGEIFCTSRDSSILASVYLSYISQELSLHLESGGSAHVAALIIEPVILGAGGMTMVDPLFQRLLVQVCRRKRIPIIFDEVFTGFWRLGVESAAEWLHCHPDIACFAKLMTGGMVPLAATLATKAIFEAFVGDSKLKALLHGHSYTAHAVGCTAASKSIKWFKDLKTNPNLIPGGSLLRELWDTELAHQISLHPAIERVVAIGTLCVVELKAEGRNNGYASLYAVSLHKKLRQDGIYTRPLGNVVYLMCGPCTSPRVCTGVLQKLSWRLDEFWQSKM